MKKLSSVSFYVPNFFHIIKSCFSLCVVPSFALVGIRPGIPLFKGGVMLLVYTGVCVCVYTISITPPLKRRIPGLWSVIIIDALDYLIIFSLQAK